MELTIGVINRFRDNDAVMEGFTHRLKVVFCDILGIVLLCLAFQLTLEL